MAEDSDHKYLTVTNIPSHFHAADLRAHFSSLVESSSFLCFHFRHRPEKTSSSDKNKGDRKLCCVVKIVSTKLDEVMRYNKQNWTTVDGELLAGECQLSQIKLTPSGTNDGGLDAVEKDRLLQMPELSPPELMPRGNVGTPTLVFLNLIQQCLLPHNLIHKLKLRFPKTAARRIYGNVDFDYRPSDTHEHAHNVGEEKFHTYSRHNILTRRLLIKNKVINDVDENTHHWLSVADDRLHDNIAQRSSTERALVKRDQKEESSSGKVVEYTDREQEFSNEEVVKQGDNDNTSANCEEPISSAAGKDTSQCVKSSDTIVGGSHQRVSSTPCHAGHRPSGLSDTFVQPAAPPEKAAQKLTNRQRKRIGKEEQARIKQLKAENIEERLIAVEKRYHNDDDAEEWDRHEASEDDPSNQERNKERLYEDEIEQPWEKGGPGVVFYTDAVFWQEREGDFDEQTTDDLDVDFSVYEGEGPGDKDIQDFLKVRQEKRFREGYDNTDRFSVGIGRRLPGSTSSGSRSMMGAFESYSKGIGRKVMESQGWREGQGLGRSMPGIVNALKGEGQGPNNKRGLGYTEIKAATYGSSGWKRARNQAHIITTIFDDPKTTDPKEPLLHRSEPSTLTHRQSHLDRFT
ncbi:hypothetical protein BsWGS_22670 [Bradybaena similaris]